MAMILMKSTPRKTSLRMATLIWSALSASSSMRGSDRDPPSSVILGPAARMRGPTTVP